MLYEIVTLLLTHKELHTHLLPFLMQFNGPIQTLLRDVRADQINSRWKLDVQNLFYIMIGIMKALDDAAKFGAFFDWLYPENMRLFQQVLNICPNELEVNKALLKFLKELTNNAAHRLRLDNINGFVIFKECCPIIINIVNIQKSAFASLSESSVAALYPDRVAELYKLLRNELQVVDNVVKGGYVQFGILQVYSDESFVAVSKALLEQVFSLDIKELPKYKSIETTVYLFILNFLKNHCELYFTYDNDKLKIGVLTLLKLGLESESNDVRNTSCYAIKSIITFIFNERLKVRMRVDMQHRINKLLSETSNLFLEITMIALRISCYEEIEGAYALGELIYSLIILDKGLFDKAKELVLERERYMRTKERMFEELQKLFDGVEFTLQLSDSDKFGKNFATFRANIKGII
eukprot:TRINITY_DN1063_c0_g1_i7.p1 TRINITY_DN1063_c0_g1~~TRINITY_DN1063_c0_g1_i7.p1  ORF type:complete len:408 (-),score=111.26 TRINITY_DN1063_c0_g1_i7:175-1398(-)